MRMKRQVRTMKGIQYDEDGFMMSPDELNADLPESTYEEIEADGAYEEAMDAEQEEEENEIHFDDGTATDISDSVTIESIRIQFRYQ